MKQYFVDILDAIVTVAKGMKITFRHLFKPSVTAQYTADELPEERWKPAGLTVPEGLLNSRSRMRLHVKIEDCIGCKQCERACPVDCIHITAEKRTAADPELFAADGTAIKLTVRQFDIDMTLCCYCALCVYPCPTDCIVMTPEYEFAESVKGNFLYRFAKEAPPERKPAEVPAGVAP